MTSLWQSLHEFLLPWRIRLAQRWYAPTTVRTEWTCRGVLELDRWHVVKLAYREHLEYEARALHFVSGRRGLPVPKVVILVPFAGLPTLLLGPSHAMIMRRVPGTQLAEAWSSCTEEQLRTIERELALAIGVMRSIAIPRGLPSGHVGSFDGGPAAIGMDLVGPFRCVAAYHDYCFDFVYGYSDRPDHQAHARRLFSHLRDCMRDDFRSVFTHGDLQAKNIMVHEGHLAAIVDWEAAAFMPEWREYRMAHAYEKNKPWRARMDTILEAYAVETEVMKRLQAFYPLSFL